MPLFRAPKLKNRSYAISIHDNDSELINQLFTNSSDEYVGADEALKNSDIYSIISQVSSDMATSILNTDKKRVQSLLDNPVQTSNRHAFWQSISAQLLLGGEAFAYRWRNVNGIDVRLEYLRPSQVNVFLLDDGTGLIYNVTFDEPEVGIKRAVPQNDMIHFRLLSKNGGMTGISPLTALANELNIKNTSNKLTIAALKQSILAPGILSITHGGLLDADKKANRARQFMKQISNSDGGPIVLDDLEEYQPLEIKADVAKLLAQTDWTGKQIAKVFGIPDSYLNGQGDQQSNIDQIKGMYANALNRYMQSIISELSIKFNCEIKADIRPAIDPLNNSYASAISSITKNGVLAQNQAAAILQQVGYLPDNLPTPVNNNPVKGGDNNGQEDSD